MTERIEIAPGSETLLEQLGIRSVRDALRCDAGELVTRTRASVVRRLRAPGGGREVYLKCYIYPRLLERVRYRFKPSRARSEYRSLETLAAAGVPCATPVAWGELRQGLAMKASFLVTEAVAGARPVDRILAEGRPAVAEVRRALTALGEMIRRMHAAEYCDNDLHWRNILYRCEDGAPSFAIIDSPRGAVIRNPAARRRGIARDLACLDKHAVKHFSRTERYRFVRAYFGGRPTREDRGLIAEARAIVHKLLRKRIEKMERDRLREEKIRRMLKDGARELERLRE